MSDQHNAGVAGCYGDDLVRTPNIDRLAGEGLRFESCYCPSPICVPSRMSFMSGRRPGENRVVDNFDILSSRILTWPERLREAGYHTALIGRMHFEGPDQFHGFETTYEELRHWRDNRPVRNQEETERVPGYSYWSPRRSVIDLSGSGRTFVQFRDEVVCDRGCRFLREQATGSDRRPFAAVIGFYNPHPPYVGARELFAYYHDRVRVPEDSLSLMPPYLAEFYSRYRDWENPELINTEAKRRALAAYYANTEHLETRVGELLSVLDETRLTENTLVIYTSDHGDSLGRRGAWGKGNMYDDAARVPMIARLPGVVPAGDVTRRNCNLRDFGPTFCDIAGAKPLAGSDAASFLPLLHGDAPSAPNVTESEIIQGPSPFGLDSNAAFKMYADGAWKMWCYHMNGEKRYSLFNRDSDRGELRDRVADPELTDLVESMKRRLLEHWRPEQELIDAAARRADRRELDAVWHQHWLHAGYAIPDGLDADVDTPYTRRLDATT
jgi:choline-sulfatase